MTEEEIINDFWNLIKNDKKKYIDLSNKPFQLPARLSVILEKEKSIVSYGDFVTTFEISFHFRRKLLFDVNKNKGDVKMIYHIQISKILPIYTEDFSYTIELPDKDTIDLVYAVESSPAHTFLEVLSEDIKDILTEEGYSKIRYHELTLTYISLNLYLDEKDEFFRECTSLHNLIFEDYLQIIP